MTRSDSGCATAGCEYAPRIGQEYCDRCASTREAAQRAADEQDPSTLFGSARVPTRASLPEHMARPVAGTAATSRKAADAVADGFRTRKHLIHVHIQQQGATGATRPEIAAALGIGVNSVNSATNTLYRQGLVGSNPEHERPDPVTGQACAVLVDEAHVERWKHWPRRARSTHRVGTKGDVRDSLLSIGECDLVHPATGEPITLGALAKLLAEQAGGARQ